MARTNWDQVAAQYAAAQAKTGISAKEWCDKLGINYQSARRYLKSRGQSPEQPETSQAAAQSAQKKVRKTAQNRKSAQSAGTAQKRKSDKGMRKPGEESPAGESTGKNTNGRDSSGRFTEGNPGNPDPVTKWPPGIQLTKTHGGYAKFLDADDLFEAAEDLRLRDELIFTRARVISVTKTLKALQQDLVNATEIPDKIALYDKILKAEQALDKNISRVESLTKTLSSLRIDDVTVPKVIADTARIKAATRKLEAEATKLERDQGGDTTELGEMVADLQDMGTGGLMSGG
jgi:hypothetical protein